MVHSVQMDLEVSGTIFSASVRRLTLYRPVANRGSKDAWECDYTEKYQRQGGAPNGLVGEGEHTAWLEFGSPTGQCRVHDPSFGF